MIWQGVFAALFILFLVIIDFSDLWMDDKLECLLYSDSTEEDGKKETEDDKTADDKQGAVDDLHDAYDKKSGTSSVNSTGTGDPAVDKKRKQAGKQTGKQIEHQEVPLDDEFEAGTHNVDDLDLESIMDQVITEIHDGGGRY